MRTSGRVRGRGGCEGCEGVVRTPGLRLVVKGGGETRSEKRKKRKRTEVSVEVAPGNNFTRAAGNILCLRCVPAGKDTA